MKIDPKTPNFTMFGKLSKNSFYLILYPAAKSINGNANLKNILTLNSGVRSSFYPLTAYAISDIIIPMIRMTPVSCPNVKRLTSIYAPTNTNMISTEQNMA